MITIDETAELELLQELKTPKALEEIKMESCPMPMAMGAPNPFALEALRRHVERLAKEGLIEMEVQDATNVTGIKSFKRRTGKWKLTSTGISEYVKRYKASVGEKK